MNMLKIIFIILCFTFFTSGMDHLKVPTTNLDDSDDDTPRFLKTSNLDSTIHEDPPSKENNLNQATQLKKKKFNLQFLKTSQFDLTIHEGHPIKENQTTQTKKKKLNLFSCCCCRKIESKKYKYQKKNAPASILKNPIINIKNFDQDEINEKSKMMIRKSSAPSPIQTQNSPIMLSRRFSEESVKSAVFLSRKSSGESIKSPTLLIRKFSAQSINSHINLSRKTSTESNKSDISLGCKFSAKRNEILETEKVKEKENLMHYLEEEASEYADICSFSSEDVLFYVCLQKNVENCQKCKTLKHVFETQTLEGKYLLYKLLLHELHNPNQHDLEIMPVWLEILLSSILAYQQDMDFSITTIENEIETSYRSKLKYVKILTKCAQIRPSGGHLFFSVLKSKFLESDKISQFFLDNNIINIEDDMMFIGDEEGVKVVGNDKFETIFLFGGIMEEVVKQDYKPTVGDVVYSNVDVYACTEDQFDILKNTSMKVENIDSNTGWILISNMIYDKRQWVSPEDFMHIYNYVPDMVSEIKEPESLIKF